MSHSNDDIDKLISDPLLASHQAHDELSEFILARVPPFQCPDPKKWPEEAQSLRQRLLAEVILKGIPDDWSIGQPDVVWGDTIETDEGYRIRKLRYEALPGLWIPSLLYEPTEMAAAVPAVLNLNGHVGPPGKAIDYKQLRCINLAKRGILAMNPEWLYFGELRTDGYVHNQSGHIDLSGVAGVGVFYLAMQRGLDVLLDTTWRIRSVWRSRAFLVEVGRPSYSVHWITA